MRRPRLDGVVPAFLKAGQLTASGLRQALASLDPVPVRIEINELFDQLGHKLATLEPVLTAVLEEVGQVIEDFLLPLNPSALITLAMRLHAAARGQIAALGPATFKDEVKLIFDAIKEQFTILDPSFLVAEVNGLRATADPGRR